MLYLKTKRKNRLQYHGSGKKWKIIPFLHFAILLFSLSTVPTQKKKKWFLCQTHATLAGRALVLRWRFKQTLPLLSCCVCVAPIICPEWQELLALNSEKAHWNLSFKKKLKTVQQNIKDTGEVKAYHLILLKSKPSIFSHLFQHKHWQTSLDQRFHKQRWIRKVKSRVTI